jgi:hypothetical protein
MATPIEEISQRAQRAIAVARGIRLVAEAHREQAIIDAEVAITKRDPAWRAWSRAAMSAISVSVRSDTPVCWDDVVSGV